METSKENDSLEVELVHGLPLLADMVIAAKEEGLNLLDDPHFRTLVDFMATPEGGTVTPEELESIVGVSHGKRKSDMPISVGDWHRWLSFARSIILGMPAPSVRFPKLCGEIMAELETIKLRLFDGTGMHTAEAAEEYLAVARASLDLVRDRVGEIAGLIQSVADRSFERVALPEAAE